MSTTIQPMLAVKLEADNLKLPCFVQPKINGIRCLWDGTTAWTRSGIPHATHIQRLVAGSPRVAGGLDGELCLEPGAPLEAVQIAVAGGPGVDALRFVCYDLITAEPQTQADRLDVIRPFGLDTRWVRTETQLESAMDAFLDSGYEGLIARRPDAAYTPGKSTALLKYKRCEDAEFRIAGVVEASGSDVGTAVFVCLTPDGKPFRVKPAGTRLARARMWRDREAWIGKPYTVQFQGYTRDGIPRFATGLAVRTDINWVMAFAV